MLRKKNIVATGGGLERLLGCIFFLESRVVVGSAYYFKYWASSGQT